MPFLFLYCPQASHKRQDEFFLSRSLFGGKRDQAVLLSQLQGLADQLQCRFHLAALELVQLVGHHNLWAAAFTEPVVHGHVVCRGFVADVNDEHAGGDEAALILEVAFPSAGPSGLSPP